MKNLFQYTDFTPFGNTPSDGIVESYSSFITFFLRNFQMLFHNGYNNLYFHQWCTIVSFSLYLPILAISVIFLYITHSNKNELKSHCVYIHLFYIPAGHWVSFQVCCPFLNGLLAILLCIVWLSFIFLNINRLSCV